MRALSVVAIYLQILNIDISQGSVALRLRFGGIFENYFIANLPLIMPASEKFVKSFGSSCNMNKAMMSPF